MQTLFVTVVKILNRFGVEYNIHAGTVLGLLRSCNLFDVDIDFAVALSSWRIHRTEVHVELKKLGFKQTHTFGNIHFSFGHEESWKKKGVKVDFFTRIGEKNNTHYATGYWIRGKLYKCVAKISYITSVSWLGAPVRIPMPLSDAAISWYGKDYMKPRNWSWTKHPFTIGSCDRKPLYSSNLQTSL
eukprot:g8022.t1